MLELLDSVLVTFLTGVAMNAHVGRCTENAKGHR